MQCLSRDDEYSLETEVLTFVVPISFGLAMISDRCFSYEKFYDLSQNLDFIHETK